jgi:hypothetical protein
MTETESEWHEAGVIAGGTLRVQWSQLLEKVRADVACGAGSEQASCRRPCARRWRGTGAGHEGAADADGLRRLAERVNGYQLPVRAAIESMNGARFVHDQLEFAGWDVDIADAQKVKGLAPLACKTDRIDAWVLAELCRRDLAPAIWLPIPGVRAERERALRVITNLAPAESARWRLHLVHHHVALQERVHARLMTFGLSCPASDLFGVQGQDLLTRLALPEPWASNVAASVRLAAIHACTHPACREHYARTKARLGKQRGPKVARVELARTLAEVIR